MIRSDGTSVGAGSGGEVAVDRGAGFVGYGALSQAIDEYFAGLELDRAGSPGTVHGYRADLQMLGSPGRVPPNLLPVRDATTILRCLPHHPDPLGRGGLRRRTTAACRSARTSAITHSAVGSRMNS